MVTRAKGALRALIKRELKKQYPHERVEIQSDGEEYLAGQIRIFGLPEPKRGAELVPGRKWSVDFYWNIYNVVVEVEGGIWQKGRHNYGHGFEADCRKYNSLTKSGFKIYRFSTDMIKSGEAIQFLEKLFNQLP